MRYRKGDIVTIRFPFTDLKNSKKRPALIISNNKVNQTGDYLMIQITSRERDDPLTIHLTKTDFTDNKELPLRSFIRLHKIFLLNESLIINKVTSIKKDFMDKLIEEVIKLIK